MRVRLIAAEGQSEVDLVSYLYDRYYPKKNLKVVVKNTFGGTPHDIIKKAIQFSETKNYEQKYIFIDTDRKIKESDINLATQYGFVFIYNTRCLEATILQILHPNINWSLKETRFCKAQLHQKIGEFNRQNLAKFFDSKKDSELKSHSTVKQIIQAIQKE